MKKLLLATVLISAVSSGWAKPAGPVSRWQKLMNLITQEMKILDNAKRKGPDLRYRMLELHSERLKLLHEKNNNQFMEKSKTVNVTANKESFFKETRDYYLSTKQFGLQLLKEFPESHRQAEVMFAMALNSRDYGKDNITEKYLLDTIALVKDPHHSLRHHAETALADFYYNEKRYSDAVVYYQRVIKKTEDEWLTKHLFNLSWCYLKTRDFDNAINAIRQSYTHSKNEAYVNIKDQVLENIGSFYVYADRSIEGLEFYLKNEKDPIPYLMPMAQKTSAKGLEKDTEKILGEAQKLIDKNHWYHHQEELFQSYLDFYRHYNRFADHELVSRKMVAYYKQASHDKKLGLKVESKEEAIEKMRSLAGFLQVRVAKDMKEDGGNFKEDEVKIVLSYFNHLIALDPKRKVEYLYFRGETYFSVKRYELAAPAYVEAVQEAKLHKNNEEARKSLNSLLALTGLEVLEKNLNLKYLIFAYSEHIAIWPRDEKSELIYPKLFEIYLGSGQDVKASNVLRDFNKAYPEHLKQQQHLMTRVLDQFIEKKDTNKLAHWVHEFKQGFLSYSRETIEKTEITLGNLLFMQYQELAKKGDKANAAKGFETIYANKLYTNKVKSQSAFFAALTYLEMGETVKSYTWQSMAYAIMNPEEKLEKRPDQLKMAERTYKLQDFVTSYKMSQFLLVKYCALKDDIQNRFYEIAVMTALVEENVPGAENIIRQYSHCIGKAEIKDRALAQVYQLMEKKGDFPSLRLFVNRYPTEAFKEQYRYTLQKWYWEKSSLNFKDQVKAEFKSLNHPETIAWLKEMDDYVKAQKEASEMKKIVFWNAPKFDGDAYNKALESYLVQINKFKDTYQHLAQSTQVDLAVLATKLLSEFYQFHGQKVLAVNPQGIDPEILNDFKNAMKQLGGKLVDVSKQFNKQLDKALKEKETLNWGARSIASVEEIENPVFSFFTGLTADRIKD